MILLPYLYCSLNSLEQSGVLPLLLPVVSQLLLAARSLPLCRIQLFPFHLPTLFLPDQLIPGEFQCLLVPQTRVNQVAPLGCDSYKQRAYVNGFMLSLLSSWSHQFNLVWPLTVVPLPSLYAAGEITTQIYHLFNFQTLKCTSLWFFEDRERF